MPKIQLIKAEIDLPIVMIGNRTDLDYDREVTKEEAKEYAQQSNVVFIETSAKLGINVKHAFQLLIQEL